MWGFIHVTFIGFHNRLEKNMGPNSSFRFGSCDDGLVFLCDCSSLGPTQKGYDGSNCLWWWLYVEKDGEGLDNGANWCWVCPAVLCAWAVVHRAFDVYFLDFVPRICLWWTEMVEHVIRRLRFSEVFNKFISVTFCRLKDGFPSALWPCKEGSARAIMVGKRQTLADTQALVSARGPGTGGNHGETGSSGRVFKTKAVFRIEEIICHTYVWYDGN